jgi:hypothetical protein
MSVGFVTVSVVEPLTAPHVCMMVVDPVETGVASPRDPAALETVALPGTLELQEQVPSSVRSCVLESLKIPVAVNWRLKPMARLGLTGVTVMDERVAAVTVSVVLPFIAPHVCVMVVLPVAREPAIPSLPAALLMSAFAVLLELQEQLAFEVRSCVELSL